MRLCLFPYQKCVAKLNFFLSMILSEKKKGKKQNKGQRGVKAAAVILLEFPPCLSPFLAQRGLEKEENSRTPESHVCATKEEGKKGCCYLFPCLSTAKAPFSFSLSMAHIITPR